MLTRAEIRAIGEEVAKHLYRMQEQGRPTESWITHKQAAEFLGVSPRTLYNRHDVPYMKQGKCRYYKRSQLEKYRLQG